MAAARQAFEVVLESLRSGGMAVVEYDGGRDRYAVAVLAAEHATPERLLALDRLASGPTFLALTNERCTALGLSQVAAGNGSTGLSGTTTAIVARDATNGVSYAERARTIACASDPSVHQDAIRLGGNIFPLRAREGGVLENPEPAEATIDLLRAAGVNPAGLLSPLVDEQGAPLQGVSLERFSMRHGVPTVAISVVVGQRLRTERLVHRAAEANIMTTAGPYRAVGYFSKIDQAEHLAMVKHPAPDDADSAVYMHPACWEGDVFGSRACECRARLSAARSVIDRIGGVVIHLAHRDSYRHPESDGDAAALRLRAGAQILCDLGIRRVRLLSDHGHELPYLREQGLDVVECLLRGTR